jgi:hypothetical protein
MSFRARYSELRARITERAPSPEQAEALRGRAEALNPDGWVTEDEVRKGAAGFEALLRDLRSALGLRRRRRSRRGGRRHRRGPGQGPGAGAAVDSQSVTGQEGDQFVETMTPEDEPEDAGETTDEGDG